MGPHDLGLASFLMTGWGVLYSVSLGWSIYALLDQWPRLIRFAFIWGKGFLRFRPGQHLWRMITCWSQIEKRGRGPFFDGAVLQLFDSPRPA